MSSPTDSRLAADVEIIAHRGASRAAPENTLAAVRRAWDLAADAVEIDCRLTSDKQIAVIHDADTHRTANRSLSISDHSLADLQSLDVGLWKGDEFRGQRIPSLAEVIAMVPPAKRFFIEVKCGPEILPTLGQVLNDSGKSLQQFVVVSYNLQVVTGIKRELPEVSAMLIARFDRQSGKASPQTVEQLAGVAADAGLDGLDLHSEGPFDDRTASLLASHQLLFYVWTVDEIDEARRLIELGVHGMATNRPAWLRHQLAM